MLCKKIVFPEVNMANLIESECKEPGKKEVMVKMCATAISAGTERASLTGETTRDALGNEIGWPRGGGYSGAGIICSIGEEVTNVKVGDRVAVRASTHSSFCTVSEAFVYKLPDDVSMEEAAMIYISTFSLLGVRHTRVEAGESAIVMGLGILGMYAVQFFRVMGAVPVIAVDPVAEKRECALRMGADYALDPYEEHFAEKVKELTGGGVNAAVEVTGRGIALDQVLDCMAKYGRVSLLGCTRNSDFTIDYYRKVHYPGIALIGAHTDTRPEQESRPGYWCYEDEYNTIFKFITNKRMDYKAMISEIHSPAACKDVYDRLVHEKSFPSGVIFDWTKLE